MVVMMNYAKYGENSAFRNKMSQEKLNNVTSSKLLDLIKNLSSYDHRITYYGPEKMNEVSNILNKYHTNNTNLKEIPGGVIYEELPLDVPLVFVVDYEINKRNIVTAKGGELNVSDVPKIKFHNSYFGGGMSSIVFQDMRESKLQYSVYSTYSIPKEPASTLFLFLCRNTV